MAEKSQSARARKSLARVGLYQSVFNSREGREVLNDMMAAHGMLTAHPADPQMMAIKEGERAVILRILTFLKLKPEQLKERMEEYERSLE